MKIIKRNKLMGMMLLLFLLATCSVNVDEKLKDPYFISWLSEKGENELKELKKDGKFDYNDSNISKWEKYYAEWDKIEEPYLYSTKKLSYLSHRESITESTILFTSSDKKIAELKGNLLNFRINTEQKEIKINRDEEWWICLDKHGNIILDSKLNPIFIKPFEYSYTVKKGQLTGRTTNDVYGRPEKITRYIYPSLECSKLTGIKNAFFVW